jgi:hypothetical protein
MERIEAALKQLADVVAGDLSVCEVARVMRLPGSHNSKEHIGWKEVEIVELHPERRFELDDLEEWLSEQSPVMLRKTREQGKTLSQTSNDFFADFAREHGIKPPIDVEKRLANMMYMGTGESSIQKTQLECSASMLNAGMAVDEVVSILLEATRRAAGEYAVRWNWRREERTISRHVRDVVEETSARGAQDQGQAQVGQVGQ